MANKVLASAMAVLLVAVFTAGQLAGEAGAQTLCNMNQEGLAACRPAVTKPNPADPSAACCAALARADLSCLCSFKNTNPGLMRYLGVDPDLAMQLPPKCNIPAPAKC